MGKYTEEQQETIARKEWYILGALDAHIRHLEADIKQSEKSIAEIEALPDDDPWKVRSENLANTLRNITSELRQHVKDFSEARTELKKFMRTW